MEFTKREYQQFYHGISMSLLSKKSAQKWRYDDETAEEIRFLEGLESKVLDKIRPADTPQTETKTETQNSNLTFEKRTMRDCYNCRRYETEGECVECKYEPKDESQNHNGEVTEMVEDEPQTEYKKWEAPPKVEPQTEITTCVSVPACLLEIEDEPQTELVRVKYHCINCAENGSYKCSKCDGEMYYKYDKDEPQTDCPWK